MEATTVNVDDSQRRDDIMMLSFVVNALSLISFYLRIFCNRITLVKSDL